MLISASALPLLSLVALFLRRNIVQGTLKRILLGAGIALLTITLIDTLLEHGSTITLLDGILGLGTALLTLYILAKFSHTHSHGASSGAKGIVLSEAFHSLIDGSVIGATYLINPVLGYAATTGIIIHELPKILGTIGILRSLGLSPLRTFLYGTLAQGGAPVSAILVYLLGAQVNEEQFHALEIASISSLTIIVLWILYLELRFHKKEHHDHNHHDHSQSPHH